MDFVDILSEYKIPYHQGDSKTREGWINLKCPYCGKDPYLGYNIAGRYTSCWSCGYKNIVEVICTLTSLGWKEAANLVEDLPCHKSKLYRTAAGVLREPSGIYDLGTLFREYVLDRGFIPNQVMSDWGVKALSYDSLSPSKQISLKWRLYIPIFFRGLQVSWTTRSIISAREPRYISATDEESIIPIKDLLYGVDHVRNTVLVCEGPIDVWAFGFGSVAIMGVNPSPAQLEQLSRIPVRLICFDNEPMAQVRAKKLCDNLSPYDGETWHIHLESGKDLASCDKQEIQDIKTKFFSL